MIISDALRSFLLMEEKHVHEVYERIASHFSATRYKPWPLVEKFLLSQPKGSIGVDIGCGNGKYIRYKHVYLIGCDRSQELLQITQTQIDQSSQHGDVFRSDALAVPVRALDFAISIAVIHHFSTRERRIAAVREALNCIGPHGQALIYVWALEQRNARPNFNANSEQDVFVPWVDVRTKEKFERYYHLYKSGELERDVAAARGEIVDSGYERDNWWAIIRSK